MNNEVLYAASLELAEAYMDAYNIKIQRFYIVTDSDTLWKAINGTQWRRITWMNYHPMDAEVWDLVNHLQCPVTHVRFYVDDGGVDDPTPAR